MKAIYLEKGGSVNVLQYGDIKTPGDCGENQVLVRIKAIGINPIDCKIRAAPERFPVTFSVIPGCNGAGIVQAVGLQVKNFKPGDEVYFSQPGVNNRRGTYTEILMQCSALFDASKLSVEIARTFGLADAVAAQNFLEKNHPIGKLVMVIWDLSRSPCQILLAKPMVCIDEHFKSTNKPTNYQGRHLITRIWSYLSSGVDQVIVTLSHFPFPSNHVCMDTRPQHILPR